jgi:hypothetical protein
MLDRTIVLGMIAACMLASCASDPPLRGETGTAVPVAAQAPAPTTTAFDGTYAGVSRTVEGSMEDFRYTRSCQPDLTQPGPLTIAGGAAYRHDRHLRRVRERARRAGLARPIRQPN